MDILMLEGWTPILLFGIGFAVVFFMLSRKVSRKSLFLTATISSLICIGIVIYSMIGIGGWDGVGLLFVILIVFLGIWIGTIIGTILRNSN